MLWRTSPARSRRTPPAGFILPCQPLLVARPPAGAGWLHEVKHDGYRIVARKDGKSRHPLEPLRHELHRQAAEDRGGNLQLGCRQRSDRRRGGRVSCGRALRFCRPAHKGGLSAGLSRRVRSLEPRRRGFPSAPDRGAARQAFAARRGVNGVLFSEALVAEGALVFANACELGLEGIVSKRVGSRYRSGNSRQWLKSKNPVFVRT